MIYSIALLIAVQQDPQEASITVGVGLMQNQMTYFCDLAIIEVSTVDSSVQDRIVYVRSGAAPHPVRVQRASILDANFDHEGEIVLVFPWRQANSLMTRIGAMPLPDELPLTPGRYFVSGRTHSDGKVAFTPDSMSNGFRDTSYQPEIRLGQIEASDGDMGVFSVFPTRADELSGHGREPEDVLTVSLMAASGVRESLFSYADVMFRTDLRPRFGREPSVAVSMLRQAKELAANKSGVEHAVLLAIMYRRGEPMVEQELFEAMITSNIEEPEFWESETGRQLIGGFSVNFTSRGSKYDYWQRNPERQVWLASLAATVESEVLRGLFLGKTATKHAQGMNSHLRRLLAKIEPSDRSCGTLLKRMAVWFNEPDRDPGRKARGELPAEYRARQQAAINYWQATIGG